MIRPNQTQAILHPTKNKGYDMRSKFAWVASLLMVAVSFVACGGEDGTDDTAAPSPSPTSAKPPSLRITSPTDGQALGGNVVELNMEVENIRIVKADGDTSGRTGHFHVFVDRDPVPEGSVIPQEPGIIHTTDDPIIVTGLPVGEHNLRVVLGDGTHKRIGTAEAGVRVNVQGPSVQAKAPTELVADQEGMLEITVQGVRLVPAAEDQGPPGETGHLHILIDPDQPPKADGTPIPSEEPNRIIHTVSTVYKLKGLGAGDHTLWIVLGNKAHVPFSPLVAHKLSIRITQAQSPGPGAGPAQTGSPGAGTATPAPTAT